MISVYMTCKDIKEAKLIANHLLQKKLVACVNIFPVTSMFWWQGKISEEPEVALLCKTKKELFNEIKEEARQMHSYNIPCIVGWGWHGSDDEYKKWVEEETK